MKKKVLLMILSLVCVLAFTLGLSACSKTAGDESDIYTVRFDAGRGTIFGKRLYEVEVDKDSTVGEPNQEPVCDGYIFIGWNVTGSENGEMWRFDTDVIAQNTTLYAVWVQSYEVTFDANGGKFDDDTAIYKINVAHNSKLTTVPNVTAPDANHMLETWWSDLYGAVEPASFTVTRDITLTAKWGLSDEIKTALASFTYTESNGGITVTGVKDKEAVTSLTVPSVVSNIAANAFKDCVNLETVVIDDSVSSIGKSAFSGCAKLKNVTLPTGLCEIDAYTFDGCSSLQSITIPATCTQIYQYAFKDSGLVTAVIHARKVEYSAFKGCTSLVNLTIGAEVEELGQDTFNGCTSLTEVEIPDNVTKISGQVFKNCSSLKTVSIGDGLTEISGGMFSGCSVLRNVELGSNVSNIKSDAFAGCISLLSFTVPSTVTEIHNKAFSGCARLVEIYNLTDEPNFLNSAKPMSDTVIHTSASDESIIKTADGFSFCMFKDSVYPYPEVPFLLDYTGNKENLVLPADYEGNNYKIFKYALSFNPQLKSVTISDGVELIRDEILLGSDNVTSLTVGSGNTYYTSKNNCVISTADSKFVLGCKTSVIPTDGSVTAIGRNVFCHNKTIINDAFKIPDRVTVVERSAFDGIEGIARTEGYVEYVDKWAVRLVYDGSDYIDLELAAGTVGIASGTFNPYNNNYTGGRHIKSVKTNAELKYICEEAFSSCDFITEVTLNNGLVSIERSAFSSCSRLEEIVVPDTVTSLGSAAFKGCSALTYAKLPSGISIINYQTFDGCTSLKEIVIPSSVTKIEHWVFNNCPSTLKVYYCGGDASAWSLIVISNQNNGAGTASTGRYYYSETPQTGVATWHYGEDGKPTTQY